MTLIELSDKAVDAIRGRAQLMSDPYFEEQDNRQAAKVLAALDERTDGGSVDFDEETLAWLERDGEELRPDIEQRAAGLICDGDLEIDWVSSTGEVHYIWAVEDIAARLRLATDPSLVSVESLQPEPVDGWKAIKNAADISAELQRLEAWWDAIEEPPPGHPDWALSCEVESWAEGWKGLYRKVLELIAAGDVDPVAAAKAALVDAAAPADPKAVA